MIDVRTEGLPGSHVKAQRCRARNREVRKLRLRCGAKGPARLAKGARCSSLRVFLRVRARTTVPRKFLSVRLSGAQGARPRIAVAGGDGRAAMPQGGWG